MLRIALSRYANCVARTMSTLAKSSTNRSGLLAARSSATGRRFMSGDGTDISKLQAILYIVIGGGGFAAFGMYITKQMRNRIESFETGKVIPFKSLTDEELLVFREKFKNLHGEEEDEDESTSSDETMEEQGYSQIGIAKSSKDTVIFIESPEE